jgi:diguanylate cyclase (GGDEF)-like protein/putative nucleotidyltransferase with HDIG domain
MQKKLADMIEKTIHEKPISDKEIKELSKEEIIAKISIYHEELIAQNNELVKTIKALDISHSMYHDLFQKTPIPIFIINPDGGILKSNQAASDFLGRNVLDNERLQSFVDESDQDKLYLILKAFNPANKGIDLHQLTFNIADETHYVDVYSNVERSSKDQANLRLVLVDKTKDFKYQEKIRYLAEHDALTKIYNRMYYEKFKKNIDNYDQIECGVLFIDLNNLKLVNDAFGHNHGDNVLKRLCKIIQSSLSKKDQFFRIGGDEFIIFMCGDSKKLILKKINEIKSRVTTFYYNDLEVSASVGYAIKQNNYQDIDVLIKLAEDNMYQEKIYASKSGKLKIVGSILSALYGKEPEEESHSKRVAELMYRFSKSLSLDESDCARNRSAGLLHDIGKITLNLNTLYAPRKLTEEEWIEIKKHPEVGYKILLSSRTETAITEAVLMHHERMDGSGYPRGIVGEQISDMAKMLNICDAFDAMVSKRSYKKTMTIKEATAELVNCSHTQFDASMVEVFNERVVPHINDLYASDTK